jgi:hypothetical protein
MHLFHRWDLKHDTIVHRYYECRVCHKRKVSNTRYGGGQPIDAHWLNGGVWDRVFLPPRPTPPLGWRKKA